jgi:hypothetical protein
MEAMRQIDEVRRLGADLPEMSAQVTVTMPLVPPLKELSPVELDIFQLAYNYGHIETILNRADIDDVAASEILVKLRRAGYIKAD